MSLPGERTKRVLIVDDEESMRLLLQRILQSIPGIETTLADSGDGAVSLASQGSFDLIPVSYTHLTLPTILRV